MKLSANSVVMVTLGVRAPGVLINRASHKFAQDILFGSINLKAPFWFGGGCFRGGRSQ